VTEEQVENCEIWGSNGGEYVQIILRVVLLKQTQFTEARTASIIRAMKQRIAKISTMSGFMVV
jgi:hypothetical protein